MSNPPNPFAPPGPQHHPSQGGLPAPGAYPAQGGLPAPGAYPAYPSAGAPVPAPPQWNQPVMGGQPAYLPPQQTGGGRGLAIAAIVMSGLALLGVLAVGLFSAGSLFAGPGFMGGYLLEGNITPVTGTTSGVALENEIGSITEDDGLPVTAITCPQTEVGQGVVVVCRGRSDGFDWTGIVTFVDDAGNFVLEQY